MDILGLFVGERKKKSCADVERMESLWEVQFMSSMYTLKQFKQSCTSQAADRK